MCMVFTRNVPLHYLFRIISLQNIKIILTSLPCINLYKLHRLWLAVITLLELNESKQPVMEKVISKSELEHNRKLFSK